MEETNEETEENSVMLNTGKRKHHRQSCIINQANMLDQTMKTTKNMYKDDVLGLNDSSVLDH